MATTRLEHWFASVAPGEHSSGLALWLFGLEAGAADSSPFAYQLVERVAKDTFKTVRNGEALTVQLVGRLDAARSKAAGAFLLPLSPLSSARAASPDKLTMRATGVLEVYRESFEAGISEHVDMLLLNARTLPAPPLDLAAAFPPPAPRDALDAAVHGSDRLPESLFDLGTGYRAPLDAPHSREALAEELRQAKARAAKGKQRAGEGDVAVPPPLRDRDEVQPAVEEEPVEEEVAAEGGEVEQLEQPAEACDEPETTAAAPTSVPAVGAAALPQQPDRDTSAAADDAPPPSAAPPSTALASPSRATSSLTRPRRTTTVASPLSHPPPLPYRVPKPRHFLAAAVSTFFRSPTWRTAHAHHRGAKSAVVGVEVAIARALAEGLGKGAAAAQASEDKGPEPPAGTAVVDAPVQAAIEKGVESVPGLAPAVEQDGGPLEGADVAQDAPPVGAPEPASATAETAAASPAVVEDVDASGDAPMRSLSPSLAAAAEAGPAAGAAVDEDVVMGDAEEAEEVVVEEHIVQEEVIAEEEAEKVEQAERVEEHAVEFKDVVEEKPVAAATGASDLSFSLLGSSHTDSLYMLAGDAPDSHSRLASPAPSSSRHSSPGLPLPASSGGFSSLFHDSADDDDNADESADLTAQAISDFVERDLASSVADEDEYVAEQLLSARTPTAATPSKQPALAEAAGTPTASSARPASAAHELVQASPEHQGSAAQPAVIAGAAAAVVPAAVLAQGEQHAVEHAAEPGAAALESSKKDVAPESRSPALGEAQTPPGGAFARNDDEAGSAARVEGSVASDGISAGAQPASPERTSPRSPAQGALSAPMLTPTGSPERTAASRSPSAQPLVAAQAPVEEQPQQQLAAAAAAVSPPGDDSPVEDVVRETIEGVAENIAAELVATAVGEAVEPIAGAAIGEAVAELASDVAGGVVGDVVSEVVDAAAAVIDSLARQEPASPAGSASAAGSPRSPRRSSPQASSGVPSPPRRRSQSMRWAPSIPAQTAGEAASAAAQEPVVGAEQESTVRPHLPPPPFVQLKTATDTLFPPQTALKTRSRRSLGSTSRSPSRSGADLEPARVEPSSPVASTSKSAPAPGRGKSKTAAAAGKARAPPSPRKVVPSSPHDVFGPVVSTSPPKSTAAPSAPVERKKDVVAEPPRASSSDARKGKAAPARSAGATSARKRNKLLFDGVEIPLRTTLRSSHNEVAVPAHAPQPSTSTAPAPRARSTPSTAPRPTKVKAPRRSAHAGAPTKQPHAPAASTSAPRKRTVPSLTLAADSDSDDPLSRPAPQHRTSASADRATPEQDSDSDDAEVAESLLSPRAKTSSVRRRKSASAPHGDDVEERASEQHGSSPIAVLPASSARKGRGRKRVVPSSSPPPADAAAPPHKKPRRSVAVASPPPPAGRPPARKPSLAGKHRTSSSTTSASAPRKTPQAGTSVSSATPSVPLTPFTPAAAATAPSSVDEREREPAGGTSSAARPRRTRKSTDRWWDLQIGSDTGGSASASGKKRARDDDDDEEEEGERKNAHLGRPAKRKAPVGASRAAARVTVEAKSASVSVVADDNDNEDDEDPLSMSNARAAEPERSPSPAPAHSPVLVGSSPPVVVADPPKKKRRRTTIDVVVPSRRTSSATSAREQAAAPPPARPRAKARASGVAAVQKVVAAAQRKPKPKANGKGKARAVESSEAESTFEAASTSEDEVSEVSEDED